MSDWSVKFEGPATEDGTMAVEDVVTVMEAASKLAKRAAATIHGRNHGLEVRVFAPQRGSLEFVFEFVWPIAATVGTSVIANLLTDYIKQKLATRRRDTKEHDDPIERLSRSKLADRALAELTSPLRHDGVLRMRLTTRDGDTFEVTREEGSQLDDTPSERTWLEESETTLRVVSPSFVRGNWRFSEGGHEFSAPITDRDFNERIQAGTETFAKGDMLECRVALYTVSNARGQQVRNEYEVTEVHERIPR